MPANSTHLVGRICKYEDQGNEHQAPKLASGLHPTGSISYPPDNQQPHKHRLWSHKDKPPVIETSPSSRKLQMEVSPEQSAPWGLLPESLNRPLSPVDIQMLGVLSQWERNTPSKPRLQERREHPVEYHFRESWYGKRGKKGHLALWNDILKEKLLPLTENKQEYHLK